MITYIKFKNNNFLNLKNSTLEHSKASKPQQSNHSQSAPRPTSHADCHKILASKTVQCSMQFKFLSPDGCQTINFNVHANDVPFYNFLLPLLALHTASSI